MTALEMVRRAERGIGLAIRNGQEAGDLRRNKEHDVRANQHGSALLPQQKKSSPSDFFSGGGTQTETYAMTDGVTDEQFEEART